ncbi:MAG: hypothetical protein LBI88_02230 [Deltaproteobacteria bacterium]|jgi:c-di-GMP-binding flagellar brake protein YcgR|nr:hypothetical protein [Deltaproteobacteria bacterium]
MNDASSILRLLDKFAVLLESSVGLKFVLLAAAFALGLGCLVAFLRKRRRLLRYAQQSRRIVQELLHNAIDQRSTLDLEFTSEDMQGRVLSATCSAVEDDRVLVDVGLEYSLQTWIDEPVEVSFKIDYKTVSTHYRFGSQVIGMRTTPRTVVMDLALPLHIHPMQKRHYVRISPLPSHLLGMGLWPLDPAQPLPQDSTTLGSAALSYRPGKLTQCSLLNLSAGGMRVEVPQVLLNQLPSNLTLQSHLLCLLLLRSPDRENPMPFWLASTVVSLMEDKENTASVIIGIKFRAWALSETGNSNIFWFPAGKSEEVAPLASWVLRHQLEQNKRQRE